MITATASGKIILFGEHAVVYGQPALAAPVTQVQASATLEPAAEIWITAQNLGRRYRLREAAANDPLAAAVRLALAYPASVPSAEAPAPFALTLTSTIPLAAGLGSGAAVCTAIVRAVAQHRGLALTAAETAALVYETEKLLHGTPSGIDNTVIAYGQPVWFVKGQPPEPFPVARPFRILIADTGRPSPTKLTVGDVRAAWLKEPERSEQQFQAIGAIVRQAREHIAAGTPEELGPLMRRNQVLLGQLGVSSPELDKLAAAAQQAGALGAKLSGGGRGGNLLALVTPSTEPAVQAALQAAGARQVFGTQIG